MEDILEKYQCNQNELVSEIQSNFWYIFLYDTWIEKDRKNSGIHITDFKNSARGAQY